MAAVHFPSAVWLPNSCYTLFELLLLPCDCLALISIIFSHSVFLFGVIYIVFLHELPFPVYPVLCAILTLTWLTTKPWKNITLYSLSFPQFHHVHYSKNAAFHDLAIRCNILTFTIETCLTKLIKFSWRNNLSSDTTLTYEGLLALSPVLTNLTARGIDSQMDFDI